MATLAQVVAWIDRLEAVYSEQKEYLTELDSAIGDADHGSNMARGFTAAKSALAENPPADIGAALKAVSMTLIKTVGGASGPLCFAGHGSSTVNRFPERRSVMWCGSGRTVRRWRRRTGIPPASAACRF